MVVSAGCDCRIGGRVGPLRRTEVSYRVVTAERAFHQGLASRHRDQAHKTVCPQTLARLLEHWETLQTLVRRSLGGARGVFLTFSTSTTETRSPENLHFSSRSYTGTIRLGKPGRRKRARGSTFVGTRPRRALRISRLMLKTMVWTEERGGGGLVRGAAKGMANGTALSLYIARFGLGCGLWRIVVPFSPDLSDVPSITTALASSG